MLSKPGIVFFLLFATPVMSSVVIRVVNGWLRSIVSSTLIVRSVLSGSVLRSIFQENFVIAQWEDSRVNTVCRLTANMFAFSTLVLLTITQGCEMLFFYDAFDSDG